MLHWLTHRHFSANKAGVGDVHFCGPRFLFTYFFEPVVMFRPAFDGAKWHEIDWSHMKKNIGMFEQLAKAENPFEAMAIVRANQ